MLTEKEKMMRRNTNLPLEGEETSRTRYALNKEILDILTSFVELYPQQRFGQIVANYVFPNYREKDIFFEESLETLRTLKNPRKVT